VSTVEVERVHALYLVPREHEDPESVRWRLDGVLRARVADECAKLVAGIDDADPSVWLIRRLELDLTLDAAAGDDALAQAWAVGIVSGIARTVAGGPDGEQVIRFADPTEHIVQFVLDVADGRAWGKWYHRTFEPLRSLPASAAIGEAMLRDPSSIRRALVLLDERRAADRVIGALGQHDARRVYEACVATGAARRLSTRQLLNAVVEAWPMALVRAELHGVATGANALRLYVRLLRDAPSIAADQGVGDAIDHALTWADLLRGASDLGAFVAAIERGDLAGARSAVDASASPFDLASVQYVAAAANGDAGLMRRLADAVASPGEPSSAVPPAKLQAFATRFAGCFLLLGAMTSLDLPELNESPTLRVLVLARCFGAESALEALVDPALALAAGVPALPTFETMRTLQSEMAESIVRALPRVDDLPSQGDLEYLALLDTQPGLVADSRSDRAWSAVARAVMRVFAQRLGGFENSSSAFLNENFLGGVGAVTIRDELIDVELPPAPLALVLRLTGVDGSVVEVPWLERLVRLTLPVD
jgi:hypothetical protein